MTIDEAAFKEACQRRDIPSGNEDDYRWFLMHYTEARKDSAALPFDMGSFENQDALWSMIRNDFASLEGLAIEEFAQDYPPPRTMHPPYEYVRRKFVFVDGGELIIKNARRKYR